ncbi:MAG: DNA polymerase III subunit gamma/tau [Planctomycetaceae bacterium]|nr:DNA polymerase III subunit gamma/tau [Planctomycetaceae bacterium]
MSGEDAHYTVMARRFRPQTFADVVGQEHVGQALRNAIRGGRVAHAYLFTGARGVGKTSTARIFAKALNCPNVVDGVPCNQCDACEGIAAGNDVDVLEIDGASNRGIDDIRALRANVGVKSMRSPYKVYIIDEVHMLTKEAFNALLKTLEEPPPNVKFVFCTTEPNKVPETILSRCQRFDFGLIGTAAVAARLQQIAEADGVAVEPEAVELVARRAAGSMRDAQSLFDQLLAFGSEKVTPDDVHRLLGTAPDERLVALADALADSNAGAALTLLQEAFAAGVQVGSLSDQLLEYLRDLLVAGLGVKTVPLLSVAERLRPELEQQAARWGAETISAAMQMLVDTKGRMQRVNYGRALLELAVVRICLLESLSDVAGMIRELKELPPAAAVAGTAPPRLPPPVAPRSSPTPDADARKKNIPAVIKPAPTPASPAVSPPPVTEIPDEPARPAASAPVTELNDESVQVLWKEVLASLPESIAGHLRNASRVAISGPNGLEIMLPARYSFSRSFCQRPESLARLESVVEAAAGRRLQCRIVADETPETAAEPVAKPAAVHKSASLDAMRKNAFVQQVTSVFGGTLVDVRPIVTTENPGP